MGKFPFTNITNLLVSFITFSNIIFNKQEDFDKLTARTAWNNYYDVIIIGGGTAGSVLASRLSEDESLTVLLLEAGGSETVSSNTPGMQDTLPGSLMDWKITSVPQNWSCQGMNDQRCSLPAGRVIGGTSSINRMYYLRGNPFDYDTWEQKFGLKSWSWKDTFPYIVRNENQTDPELAKSGYFGVNGPLPLEKSPEYHHLLESFIFTSKLSGYKVADLNTVPVGTSILQTTTRKGKRVSTASAFLEPHLRRRNLHILSNSFVYQILFDQQQAIGLRFFRNWKSVTVYAKREIILSAGAINSPKLLLLSGVGPREELRRHSIPLVADLPVGENLHDHVGSMGMHFTVDLPTEGTTSSSKQTLKQYFQTGRGPLAEARVAATMFKSSVAPSSLKYSGGQEYESHQESPDLMLLTYQHGIGTKEMTAEQAEQRSNIRRDVWNRYYRPHMGRTQFTILPVVLKPKSRGTVRLGSANPIDPPLVDPSYLSHPEDRDRLLEAMYEALRHVQSRSFRAFNTEMFHSIIPGCETEAPFQVQDPTVLVTASADVHHDATLENNKQPPQSPRPIISSSGVLSGLAPMQQNISTSNKFVTSFLTKILFDSSKKEHTSGGVGSFFGLRTRKQRSQDGNLGGDYERYWLKSHPGATTSNSRNQVNMIDGFSGVSAVSDYTDMSEEIEAVWSNHQLRNRNSSYGHRPEISYSHTSVTVPARRTTPKSTLRPTLRIATSTTTKKTTTTPRPKTTRKSPTRRVTTTTGPYLEATPEVGVVSTPANHLLSEVIIDRNPMLEPHRYVTTLSPPPPTSAPFPSPPTLPTPISDQYLRCMARQLTAPMGDYVGTCRMGADGDSRRVVDAKFRVVGIEGLRVVDASVVPEIVSGGIATVAVMLGERAADIIKMDLRRSRTPP